MTQDVRLVRNEDGLYDLNVVDQDFEAEDGFNTAIIVSLFTDARAPASAVPSAMRRRGWVGNILTADINRSLGGLLWLYDQARITQEILNQLTIEAQNSLDWMVKDGIARDVTAEVTNETKRGIVVNIEIVTLEGVSQRYAVLWRATGNGSNL